MARAVFCFFALPAPDSPEADLFIPSPKPPAAADVSTAALSCACVFADTDACRHAWIQHDVIQYAQKCGMLAVKKHVGAPQGQDWLNHARPGLQTTVLLESLGPEYVENLCERRKQFKLREIA